ncbi:MAG: hypothetical protein JSU70_20135 [Phycisphaerales bacterium]|nr:MAG: hypothetical protein JSU70_20135 [Phycisphaerales bacterium]
MNPLGTILKPRHGMDQSTVGACLWRVFASVLCLLSSSCQAHAQAHADKQVEQPFVEKAEYDRAVSTPESVIGHHVAEKAVRYPALVRYLEALAKASDRVTLTSYGQTHEGRTLYYLTITSPANHRRLDQIKAENAELADPRRADGAELADRLAKTPPAVAWLNYSIHGDELSSTDAAIFVVYHLAAAQDTSTKELLEQVVIHINPLVNPDGRERYLSHLQQLTGVVSSPDIQSMQHQALWSRGRGNHYLFDLNRDWLVHLQPEVRTLAEVILAWNPHLLVDSHEQGAYDTYLFDPPREPLNIHLSPSVLQWRRRFSADQAEAFNRYGWSYYTQDWYSEWSPIYTNAWASLQGAIGLLYEQARSDAASVKHPTGELTSYRQTVHHHIVSSLANLETLRANRRQILSDFLQDRQRMIEQEDATGAFLLPPCEDTSRWMRIAELIKRQGIEAEFARESFEAEDATDMWGNKHREKAFPKGTLIARLRQPRGRMLRALCEFDPRMTDSFLLRERKELENRRRTLIYDVSSWNLPMAFGLESYWAGRVPTVERSSEPSAPLPDATRPDKEAGYGYLIDFADSRVYSVLVHLFDNGCHPRVAVKPFKIAGREFQRGTVLLRGHENPDNLLDVLRRLPTHLTVGIHGLDGALAEDGPDLGSQKFELLSAPRVAIASQWPVRSTSFGSIWYLLDHDLGLRSSPINIQSISYIDLRKYNVLVLGDSGGLERVLDGPAVEKIKTWVEAGGTLIAIGSSAAFAADEDRQLSSVRLKRDVLDKLEEYNEAAQREKDARTIRIDPNKIWGSSEVEDGTEEPGPKGREAEDSKESRAKQDIEKLKRTDEWQRIFSPAGTFLAGTVETEHWLGFGLPERLPVMFWGSRAFMSKHPVRTVVRLGDEDELRLSGLLWPEAKERIAGTAYATVESVGRGQLILFATDPTYRMWLPAIQRLFANAVLLGPGMGTSQPSPW